MKLPNIFRLARWIGKNWRKITLTKVKNWFVSYIRMNRQESSIQDIIPSPAVIHEREQFNFRVDRVAKLSPGCLNGACIHCGCDTPEKFWETAACEQGCYPVWMDDTEWTEFKKTQR